MTDKQAKPVIITTAHRGVFYGRLEEHDEPAQRAVLTDAIMAIRWGTTNGFLQLAATGPTERSKLSARAPRIKLEKVVSVTDVSPEAEAVWSTK